MGGYNSGRKASGEKNVEDYYTLDICWLYRNGLLEPGRKTVIRFGKSFAIRMKCKTRFWGWEQCLHVEYPVWNDAGKIETREQVIGFEWVSTLKGKTRSPYFYCPMLEIRAGLLLHVWEVVVGNEYMVMGFCFFICKAPQLIGIFAFQFFYLITELFYFFLMQINLNLIFRSYCLHFSGY
ncbi:hypothetical protein [Endozoicomonas sp. SESOKO1]|uniref:hypothetical protein n=1 Tax=Endozoicomonas sp. SESOKO1 TaxID=2828742 RepID=UPI0021498101|nr:hypothetical protein [Endozoicomonas sp. SESOKO1]